MSGDLGLVLFRRALVVGFDKLSNGELSQLAEFEEVQLRSLVELPDGADRQCRARLHLAIRDHAAKALTRRGATLARRGAS